MEKIYKQAKNFLTTVYMAIFVMSALEGIFLPLLSGTVIIASFFFFAITLVQLTLFRLNRKKGLPAFFTLLKVCIISFAIYDIALRLSYLFMIDFENSAQIVHNIVGVLIALVVILMIVAIAAELIFARRMKLEARKEAEERGIVRTKTDKVADICAGLLTVLYILLLLLLLYVAVMTNSSLVLLYAPAVYTLCTLVQMLLFHLSKKRIAPWWLPIVKVAVVSAVLFYTQIISNGDSSYPFFFVCAMIVVATVEVVLALWLRRVRKSEKAEAEALSAADEGNVAEE